MLSNLRSAGMAAEDRPMVGPVPRSTSLEKMAKLSGSLGCTRGGKIAENIRGRERWVHRVVDLFADHRGKLFWSEVEDVEQEIIKSDDLNAEGRKCLVGKVSNVVRDDRICAGNECARHDMSVVFIGENDRALEALPARDRCIFERLIHTAEAILDLLC